MVDRREVLVGAAAATSLLAAEAVAQSTTTPGEQLYAITYIEVAPAAADAARGLIARYRESPKSRGALGVAVLQQIGRSNHFAIVEQWPGAKAREDNAASAASREFRAALAPVLIAPYDERPHFALSVAPQVPGPAALHVVTHVDLVPPKREEGAAAVAKFTEASRGTAGNVRFDALVQASRQNHLTLVEVWADAASQQAHTAAKPTRALRDTLGPMSGSLYDERLYALLM